MPAKKTKLTVAVTQTNPALEAAKGGAVTEAPKMKRAPKAKAAAPHTAVAALVGGATSPAVPPSKAKARAEAAAAVAAKLAEAEKKAPAAAGKKTPAVKAAPAAGPKLREGTNKSRALAALAGGKPVAVADLIAAVYGDGKGFAEHKAGIAGVLIGCELAAKAAGAKWIKAGKGAEATYAYVEKK